MLLYQSMNSVLCIVDICAHSKWIPIMLVANYLWNYTRCAGLECLKYSRS